MLISADDVIVAGHGRVLAAKLLGLAEVLVIVLDHLSEAQRRALVIADNRIAENAGWDEAMLRAELAALREEEFDLDVLGFSDADLLRVLDSLDGSASLGDEDAGGSGNPPAGSPASEPSATLAERFGIPPFSVLDARKGWWQERKRAWIDLGIRSELGRGAAPGGSPRPAEARARSIGRGWRKPHLPADRRCPRRTTRIPRRKATAAGGSWHEPHLRRGRPRRRQSRSGFASHSRSRIGHIDLRSRRLRDRVSLVLPAERHRPRSAGGSVRGIVASKLGRRYVGIELRPEQVAANAAQLNLADGPRPEWRQGDAREIARLAGDIEADLIFSCAPHWNLERYSDDPSDLSNMPLEEFFAAYTAIIRDAIGRLRNDRFAVWVISDVRDDNGCYVNLPG